MIRSGVFLLKILFVTVPSQDPSSTQNVSLASAAAAAVAVAASSSIPPSPWINVTPVTVTGQSESLFYLDEPITRLITKRSLVNSLQGVDSTIKSTLNQSLAVTQSSINDEISIKNLTLKLEKSVSSSHENNIKKNNYNSSIQSNNDDDNNNEIFPSKNLLSTLLQRKINSTLSEIIIENNTYFYSSNDELSVERTFNSTLESPLITSNETLPTVYYYSVSDFEFAVSSNVSVNLLTFTSYLFFFTSVNCFLFEKQDEYISLYDANNKCILAFSLFTLSQSNLSLFYLLLTVVTH